MTATDLVLIAGVAGFVGAWWIRSLPRRPLILAVTAMIAIVAGCTGVWLDRWQDGVGLAAGLAALSTLGVNRLRKAPPRRGPPFLSGSLFTAAAALAILAIVQFPVDPLPKPSGPYAVGVRTFELSDTSRPGVLHARPNEPRRLLVRVWYPAGKVTGYERRPYFTPAEAHTMGRSIGELIRFPPFFTYLRHARTNSYENAPLRPGSAHLPVVFYNHGYTSFLGQNTALMENLASHGYAVFSTQHTFDSTATLFPNGDVAPIDPDLIKGLGGEGGKPSRPQMMSMFGSTLDERMEGALLAREQALAKHERLSRSGGIWLADELFVHDRLQAGDVPKAIQPIVAASELSRIGEMGMSFGGAIAGAVCLVDRRCAAGVNLDGGDYPFQTLDRAMPVPFLMFHSDAANLYRQVGLRPRGGIHSFNEFSYEPLAGAGTNPDVYRVALRGAQHIGLSDFSLFMRGPLRNALLGTTPTTILIGAQNDFVLGFFDHHLRGLANGFPQPQMAAYAGWESRLPNADVRAWWTAKTLAQRAGIEARIERDRRGPEQLPAAFRER